MNEVQEKKDINIFNYPWHVAHQYSLCKIPDTKWYQLINPFRAWGGKHRPSPENRFEVPHYEPGKYDVAVLHLDQQCIDENIGKAQLFMQVTKNIKDIPKIVINHGTPFWPEEYDASEIITKMKMLCHDCHMVYNSHRAKEMWESQGPIGLSGQTIIHGIDEENEWYDLPKEPMVATMLSPAGLPKYYNRELLNSVRSKLKERGIRHLWVGGDWVAPNYEEYRNVVGRMLVYFNPTLESPMPRSRSEAMLSGACVVTLPNHGAEDFIKHGVNGFHVPNNPTVIADFLEKLVNENYDLCVKIGQEGKKTAKELFNAKRYQKEWTELLKSVISGNHGKNTSTK